MMERQRRLCFCDIWKWEVPALSLQLKSSTFGASHCYAASRKGSRRFRFGGGYWASGSSSVLWNALASMK